MSLACGFLALLTKLLVDSEDPLRRQLESHGWAQAAPDPGTQDATVRTWVRLSLPHCSVLCCFLEASSAWGLGNTRGEGVRGHASWGCLVSCPLLPLPSSYRVVTGTSEPRWLFPLA